MSRDTYQRMSQGYRGPAPMRRPAQQSSGYGQGQQQSRGPQRSGYQRAVLREVSQRTSNGYGAPENVRNEVVQRQSSGYGNRGPRPAGNVRPAGLSDIRRDIGQLQNSGYGGRGAKPAGQGVVRREVNQRQGSGYGGRGSAPRR